MLGQYELIGRIAMGGMAEILRARQRSEAGFEKDVVIKRILPQYVDDVDFIRMFQDEAVLAAKLSHPNIVQVFDFKNIDGAYFIAMEYVEGVDLRRLIQYGSKLGMPLGPNRAVQVALAMARGLGHAHERMSAGVAMKIVHRDVSPHNVLVSMAGDVKVMDFGIAKAAARAVRTSTGILKGKVAYMSPEQALGSPDIDHRTDIYATGVVLWEMLANKRLFQGDSEMEMLARVQRGVVTPIREAYPDVTPELEACVNKFLTRDKEQRYQRMRDAERDLSQILTKLGGPDTAPLEDYAALVVPEEIVSALQGLGQPTGGTKRLTPDAQTGGSAQTASLDGPAPHDAAATQVFDPVDSEVDAGRTVSEPRFKPVTVTVTPVAVPTANPARRILLVVVALGVAAIAGAALTASLLKPTPPQPVAAVVEATEAAAKPLPEPVATPPPPVALPVAPAAVVAEKPKPVEAEKKTAKPPAAKVRAPDAARAGAARLELEGCAPGTVVYDGERAIGSVSERNRDSFPVSPGARNYSVRNSQGQTVGGPLRLNLADGEMETFRCR